VIRVALDDSRHPFRARPATGLWTALTSPGLQATKPPRCEPGSGDLPLGAGPVAVVVWESLWVPDRALMYEPGPPSAPHRPHLFPSGGHGPRRGFLPWPVIYLAGRSASDYRSPAGPGRPSQSPRRLSGPAPPPVPVEELGPRPSECLRGLGVRGRAFPTRRLLWWWCSRFRVTTPGRPRGWAGCARTAYPSPITRSARGDRGEIRRHGTRVRLG
jgi:hypothetical protein